ncbi:MAG: class B sortase [Lachnospiraceae bacterium]|nr:class B sortase [Lachnospiraceae bacterium]
MHQKKISKETAWAVSIIVVCILAGCFLLHKMNTKQSDINILSDNGDMIVLQEINKVPTDSSLSSEESAKTQKVSEISAKTKEMLSAAETTDVFSQIFYDCPIDFETLWETNPDVYAWITIPETVIDYPILQHATDDSYYLNYTIDGVEGYLGCIYTERVNSKDFTDNNTVIYGHNMRNGTMFTDLHKFREADFFVDHDTVYIYTPSKQLTYKIFAAYLYDDRHLTNSFDFSDMEVYSDYLEELPTIITKDETANYRNEISPTDTNKIITLITCIQSQPEKRVYVQAVLQP